MNSILELAISLQDKQSALTAHGYSGNASLTYSPARQRVNATVETLDRTYMELHDTRPFTTSGKLRCRVQGVYCKPATPQYLLFTFSQIV